uniref:Uncharacterized protein isoform X1 n=1 Tax=Nicotiana tabacum TaxID=4097 RepID=A0A1S3X8P4_TOBAC|nr:PREDICTED: uncharacterized protein LOC107762289 isoform X1 [Nicotiana tabacum]XP_016436119.1 PREDICTED: uncharacterized protein LOC107762289 isoform X1 [Nicotiana tabacum]
MGKNVCIDRVTENSKSGDVGPLVQQPLHDNLNAQDNVPTDLLTLKRDSFVSKASVPASPLVSHLSKYQMGVQSPRIMQDHKPDIVLNASVSSPAAPDRMLSYTNAMTSRASIHGKRETQDGQESSLPNSNKRRVRQLVADVNYQQYVGTQVDGLHAPDYHWKNALLLPQSVSRAIPYANTMQNYCQQTFQGGLNQEARTMPFAPGQQGIRYNVKKQPAEIERMDQLEPRWTKNERQVGESAMNLTDFHQARLHQILPQQLTQFGFPQTTWNGLGQPLETNPWKAYSLQKRKIVQSPCASAGGLRGSPLSSISGGISGGPVGPQYGAAVVNGLTQLMKEKPAATSVPSAGVLTFMTSIANGSMQQQHLPQVAAKRRSNSVPKAPVMTGAGSPASASNMGFPFYASSAFVGTPPLADQIMLERFSKIKMVTTRFQLNRKKNKVDEYSRRKQNVYPAQQLLLHLSNNSNNENFKDEICRMALSKSLVGGSMNICKKRALTILQTEEVLQGLSALHSPSRSRYSLTDLFG